MFNFIAKLTNKEKASSNYLPFRVMFRSPFFELEVDSGNGWQTVHSQEPETLSDGTIVYQVLRFRSFNMAESYAKDTLGLSLLKPNSLFGMYRSPTASFEKNTTMIVQPKHGVVNGEIVAREQVDKLEKAERVIPVRVFGGQPALGAA
jgi:hypothetical protein